MSKVCKSCGKYYDGEFCPHCGYGNKDLKTKAANKYKKHTKPVRFMDDAEKQEYYERLKQEHEQKTSQKKAAPKSNKNLLIAVAVVAVGIIVAGLIRSGVISWGEKTDVINTYFEAITDRDFDKYISCFPAEMKEDYEKDREELGCSKDEYMEKFVEVFKDEYGDGFTVSAKCGKETKLEDYNMDKYKSTYGSVPSISEAYVVVTDVTLRGSEKTSDEQFFCYVGKVKGSWKLFNLEYSAGTLTPEMAGESK